jgi:hypothetical protein
MRKRRNADEVARLLREADRDLAKGLTVGDICRKIGIAHFGRARRSPQSSRSRHPRWPQDRSGGVAGSASRDSSIDLATPGRGV